MKIANQFLLLLFLSLLFSCQEAQITSKNWVCNLIIDGNNQIPFHVELDFKDSSFKVVNGSERIVLDLRHRNDSFLVQHPAYLSELRFLIKDDNLVGKWYHLEKQRQMPLNGVRSSSKPFFVEDGGVPTSWQVTFSPSNPKNSYRAKGLFNTSKGKISGTFLTETGDYRFLNGRIRDDSILLSTFDFAHAFLFKAKRQKDSMSGMFWSGKHYNENWVAIKNAGFELRNPYEITKVRNSSIGFNVPLANGQSVALTDNQFQNKAVIVQIFGSWCPNCYDETRFLNQVKQKYNDVAIVGFAFENDSTAHEAQAKLDRYRDALKVDYPIYYAGPASKQIASKTFPFLNEITSFPTTLYYDKFHRLVKVHTGFNGPGTGKVYEDYKKVTYKLIDKLIDQ